MQEQSSAIATAFSRVPNDPRVLVVDGFGASLKVNRGQLVISDGLGPNRRERVLPKVEKTVRRIIILNAKGSISFDAIRWCSEIGVTLTYTDIDGSPLMGTTVTGEDARLRRSQAFAGVGGPNESIGLLIAKELVTQKIKGQEENLRLMGHTKSASQLAKCIEKVPSSDTLDQCRGWEGKAASVYWDSWIGTVCFPWKDSDESKVPSHWQVYVSRASLESGRARRATDPVNAMLNYCYRIAEVESVLACHATGLDPTMGFLHQDKDYRNSLALDLMELIRPMVDRFILEMLGEVGDSPREFSRFDFAESGKGICRIMPTVTHDLAEQSVQWARFLAPLVEDYAQIIASAGTGYVRVGKPTDDKTLMRKPPKVGKPRASHGSKPVSLEGVVTIERLIPDDVWEKISPMLPPISEKPRAGRPATDFRSVVAGIVCVEKLGASWARIPRTLGVSRFTCKSRLDEWKRDGVWPEVWEVIRNASIT